MKYLIYFLMIILLSNVVYSVDVVHGDICDWSSGYYYDSVTDYRFECDVMDTTPDSNDGVCMIYTVYDLCDGGESNIDVDYYFEMWSQNGYWHRSSLTEGYTASCSFGDGTVFGWLLCFPGSTNYRDGKDSTFYIWDNQDTEMDSRQITFNVDLRTQGTQTASIKIMPNFPNDDGGVFQMSARYGVHDVWSILNYFDLSATPDTWTKRADIANNWCTTDFCYNEGFGYYWDNDNSVYVNNRLRCDVHWTTRTESQIQDMLADYRPVIVTFDDAFLEPGNGDCVNTDWLPNYCFSNVILTTSAIIYGYDEVGDYYLTVDPYNGYQDITSTEFNNWKYTSQVGWFENCNTANVKAFYSNDSLIDENPVYLYINETAFWDTSLSDYYVDSVSYCSWDWINNGIWNVNNESCGTSHKIETHPEDVGTKTVKLRLCGKGGCDEDTQNYEIACKSANIGCVHNDECCHNFCDKVATDECGLLLGDACTQNGECQSGYCNYQAPEWAFNCSATSQREFDFNYREFLPNCTSGSEPEMWEWYNTSLCAVDEYCNDALDWDIGIEVQRPKPCSKLQYQYSCKKGGISFPSYGYKTQINNDSWVNYQEGEYVNCSLGSNQLSITNFQGTSLNVYKDYDYCDHALDENPANSIPGIVSPCTEMQVSVSIDDSLIANGSNLEIKMSSVIEYPNIMRVWWNITNDDISQSPSFDLTHEEDFKFSYAPPCPSSFPADDPFCHNYDDWYGLDNYTITPGNYTFYGLVAYLHPETPTTLYIHEYDDVSFEVRVPGCYNYLDCPLSEYNIYCDSNGNGWNSTMNWSCLLPGTAEAYCLRNDINISTGGCHNCTNGIKDGLETEVDYGGYICGSCGEGLSKSEDEKWDYVKLIFPNTYPFPKDRCEEYAGILGLFLIIVVMFVLILSLIIFIFLILLLFGYGKFVWRLFNIFKDGLGIKKRKK